MTTIRPGKAALFCFPENNDHCTTNLKYLLKLI